MNPYPARQVLIRLARFLRPFWKQVLLSILLGVGTLAAGIGLLGTSAWLIARAAQQPSIAVLQVSIVGVRFFGIARGLLRYGERLASHNVNFSVLARLRVWFYKALLPLSPARLVDIQGGDLLSRAVADIETLENFYVRALAPFLSAAVVTLGMGLFTAAWDTRLALALMLGLIAGGALLPALMLALGRKPARTLIQLRAQTSALLIETIQGISDLTAFGQAPARRAALDGLAAAGARAQMRQAWVGGLGSALGVLIQGLTLLAVLWIAIPLVRAGRMDAVLLAVAVLLTLASFEAVSGLPAAGQQMEASLTAARRLFSLTDTEPAVREGHAALVSHPAGGVDVRISGLTFRYAPDSPPALESFTLDLPAGKHVALVGPSGAGKTTLINLLLRFWEAPPGAIFFNGQDIRAVSSGEARACIGLVAQSTALFTATLRQNLQLARPDATPADLEAALQAVGLWQWCAALPDGLDTWVGERGVQLSAGERQRLAVARALLQDAPVLLLDEASANLDALNERRLLETIQQVTRGRSLLMITHRLVGLEQMDEIVVLAGGKVLQRGTHAALLRAEGLYRRWHTLQEQVWLDDDRLRGTSRGLQAS